MPTHQVWLFLYTWFFIRNKQCKPQNAGTFKKFSEAMNMEHDHDDEGGDDDDDDDSLEIPVSFC